MKLLWPIEYHTPPHYWESKDDSFQDALEHLSETHEVYVVAWHQDRRDTMILRGINYRFCGDAKEIVAHAKQIRPDLINFWGFGSPVNRKLVEAFPSVPKTVYFVGGDLGNSADFPYVCRVFVTTPEQKEALKRDPRSSTYPHRQIIVCPFAASASCMPKIYGKPSRYDVIYAADWREKKRQHLLIQALPELNFNRILFLGALHDPKYFAEWAELVARRYDRGYCEVISRVPGFAVADYYRESRVAVHLSETEGGSRVLTEVLACGLPLIVTADCESNAARIQHGETGFIVEPKPKAIARQIRELLERPSLCEEIGKAAAASIPRGKSVGSMTQIFDAEFTKILQGK